MDRPPDLPDYETPPLAEVVLGVQFVPPAGSSVAHLGLLWARFRGELPHVEERPPLPRVFETLDGGHVPEAEVAFRFADRPPAPRLWFLNADRSELLQVQEDRLIHNWRKTGEGAAYPRYECIRERFKDELGIFQTYLEEEGLGTFTPDQVEVTYVNHIVAGIGWSRHSEISRVFSPWSAIDVQHADFEDAGFSTRHVMTDADHAPFGRLHLAVRPVLRSADGSPMFIMELTARGSPMPGSAVDGVLAFMNAGREAIVRMFTAVTTPRMHDVWGRRP